MWGSLYSPVIQGFVLTALLHVCTGISIEVVPPKPKPGQTVTFRVTGIIDGSIRFATWYKGQSTSASDQILNFFPPSTEIRGNKYFSKAKGQANGSLVITEVEKTLDGYYTVQVQTNTLQQGSVQLTLHDNASSVLSSFALTLGMVFVSAINFL